MSTKDGPKVIQSNSIENIQTIGTVDQMYQKFVRNIDSFRSLSTPPGLGVNRSSTGRDMACIEELAVRTLNNLSIDGDRFVESRAHAFYRMIGLPVAASNGQYYNAGHDPNQSSTLKSRSLVDLALNEDNEDIVTLAQNREEQYKKRREVFAKQNDISSVYALMLAIPKSFVMKKVDSTNPFENDNQTQTIAGRKEKIESFNSSASLTDDDGNTTISINGNIVPNFVINVQHTLKPFIVIPEIEISVTPEYKRRICVPFLPDKASTRSTQEDELARPIIEYILHQRLRVSVPDAAFNTRARLIIEKTTGKTGIADAELITTLQALSGEESLTSIKDDVFKDLTSLTSLESATILMFIKAIKMCTMQLNDSIKQFNDIRSQITIQPIPDMEGPEFLGRLQTVSSLEQPSEAEYKLIRLQLAEASGLDISEMDPDDFDVIGGSKAFAGAFAADIAKDPTFSVNNRTRERDAFGSQLLNHLRTIEIITGEISGIGLVDILAIYTALWAIDIKYLIGLLDNESLKRLESNFPNLITDKVKEQLGKSAQRPKITESLEKFEEKLFNILSFADKVFEQNRKSKKLAGDTGSIR